MRDKWQREISYLRISLTDRCNLRCRYCMPADGIKALEHGEILRNEEIIRLVQVGVGLGIKKVRLTGGEPLVRKGLLDLIRQLAQIPEIEDLALTTNGILLAEQAEDLKKAGLQRVNISLDTLDPQKYREITRGGDLQQVWAGIKAAFKAGLRPVKINAVAIRGFNETELADLAQLSRDYPLEVRFIELMPLGISEEWGQHRQIAAPEIKAILEEKGGALLKEDDLGRSGPAKYYHWPQAPGKIGFITPISEHFCRQCNRLRLTAEGRLKPCLYSSEEVDIKKALRSGASEAELRALWEQAVSLKPQQHSPEPAKSFMSRIGG